MAIFTKVCTLILVIIISSPLEIRHACQTGWKPEKNWVLEDLIDNPSLLLLPIKWNNHFQNVYFFWYAKSFYSPWIVSSQYKKSCNALEHQDRNRHDDVCEDHVDDDDDDDNDGDDVFGLSGAASSIVPQIAAISGYWLRFTYIIIMMLVMWVMTFLWTYDKRFPNSLVLKSQKFNLGVTCVWLTYWVMRVS